MLTKGRKLLDYLPIALIVLLFMADAEMERHAVYATYQAVITMATLLVFFVLLFRYNSKTVAFVIAVVLWIALVAARNRYIK